MAAPVQNPGGAQLLEERARLFARNRFDFDKTIRCKRAVEIALPEVEELGVLAAAEVRMVV